MTIYTVIDTAIAACYITAIAIFIAGIISTATATPATAPETTAPAPVAIAPSTRPTISNLIKEHYRPATVTAKPAPATVYDTFTIRQLRQHIRDNALQKVVKDITGKSVSKCTKSELLGALS